MNRVTFLVLVSLVATGAAVAVSPDSGDRTLSPGPLHQDHVDTNCSDCHAPGRGVTDEKCLDCHEEVDKPGNQNFTLHTNFTSSCVKCHDDHDGRNASLTFAVNHETLSGDCGDCHGTEVRETFPASDHWDTDCGDCHGTEDWTVAEFDHSTTDETCESCHENDLQEEFPASDHWDTDCGDCHGTEDWNRIEFDHREYFPLRSEGHYGLSCEDCHPESRSKGFEETTCSAGRGCHPSGTLDVWKNRAGGFEEHGEGE